MKEAKRERKEMAESEVREEMAESEVRDGEKI